MADCTRARAFNIEVEGGHDAILGPNVYRYGYPGVEHTVTKWVAVGPEVDPQPRGLTRNEWNRVADVLDDLDSLDVLDRVVRTRCWGLALSLHFSRRNFSGILEAILFHPAIKRIFLSMFALWSFLLSSSSYSLAKESQRT